MLIKIDKLAPKKPVETIIKIKKPSRNPKGRPKSGKPACRLNKTSIEIDRKLKLEMDKIKARNLNWTGFIKMLVENYYDTIKTPDTPAI